MSAREWKPGDVANILTSGEQRAFRTTVGWTYIDGSSSPLDADGYAPRTPLVVIDPEDREQVERLHALWCSAIVAGEREQVPSMQAALREFANPKPPKPEEPTGLGAVVEDEDGSLLIRNAPSGSRPWVTIHGATFDWADIDPARILSEGVRP